MTKLVACLLRNAKALERIAGALEGCEISDNQEPSCDAFRCPDCGNYFYTKVRLEPTAITCPFCQSDKVAIHKVRGGDS